MNDYILLMHSDTVTQTTEEDWEKYFYFLREQGAFIGGSAIGAGEVLRKDADPGEVADHLVGYILVSAVDFNSAKVLVKENPVFESGGSIEVRELPRD